MSGEELQERKRQGRAEMMITAQGLTKYYGKFTAIEDLTFEIPKGQVVAFLGPNGAGKTTAMRILTGFLAPSRGSATVAGHSVLEDRLNVAAKTGYLPEDGPLYPDMTPEGFLEFMGEARGLRGAKLKERIEAVVHQCALESVWGKAIGKLSKGFRQRVGVAQALLHDPEVLILDEPTGGLDPNQIRDVRETLLRLGGKKTILLSTHILQEVTAMADRVILIHEGRIAFDGPRTELEAKGSSLEEVFYKLTGNSNGQGGKQP